MAEAQSSKRNRKWGRNRTRSASMMRYNAENRSEKNRIARLTKLLVTQPTNKQIKVALEHGKSGKRRI